MAKHKYLTSPPNLTGMPPGVPFIIGNEAAERFSYYGMKSVLTVFMAHYILNQSGVLAPMSSNEAYMFTHYFVFGVYFLPIFGAIMADGWLGKYWTILSLSIVYCFGNLTLALMGSSWGIAIGQRTDARNRIDVDLFRRGRHQTMRIGQRWRSVWRLEQASAVENVWLVLFLDQRGLFHFFASLSLASFAILGSGRDGHLEFRE